MSIKVSGIGTWHTEYMALKQRRQSAGGPVKAEETTQGPVSAGWAAKRQVLRNWGLSPLTKFAREKYRRTEFFF